MLYLRLPENKASTEGFSWPFTMKPRRSRTLTSQIARTLGSLLVWCRSLSRENLQHCLDNNCTRAYFFFLFISTLTVICVGGRHVSLFIPFSFFFDVVVVSFSQKEKKETSQKVASVSAKTQRAEDNNRLHILLSRIGSVFD